MRARLTVTFGLGALALSASMAGLTYFTARQFTLSQRQQADVREAFTNASIVVTKLRAKEQYTALLGRWTARGYFGPGPQRSGIRPPPDHHPGRDAHARESSPIAATQRINIRGTPELVVGVSLPSVQAQYYEVFSLQDSAQSSGFSDWCLRRWH